LGIEKTDPAELTPEEIQLFARLDIDVSTISFQRGSFWETKNSFAFQIFWDFRHQM
jgi:hypothetical protein